MPLGHARRPKIVDVSAAALAAAAALAVPQQGHGVAKVGLGVAGLKNPGPADANLWVGTVGPAVTKSALRGAALPKVKVRSGRRKGVVVIYGLKRLAPKSKRYRLLIFALRAKAPPTVTSSAKNEIAIETLEASGGDPLKVKQSDRINGVVGANVEPTHGMLDLSGFTFRTGAGRLGPDQRSDASKARHDIALNAFMARYAYRQAFDLSDDPDDAEFLRMVEECCEDE